MNACSQQLKTIFILHKDEILKEWKKITKNPNFSYDYSVGIAHDQTFTFLFDYFVADLIETESEHHQLENMIREHLVIFPGCISNQFENRLKAEEIFISFAQKYHPTGLTIEETQWIQSFFKKFSFIFIMVAEEIKDEMNDFQIQKLKDQNTKNVQLLERISATLVHEFRNPLTVVIGFLQLLKKEQPDLPYMDNIYFELEQLNDRMSQFLALSKKEAVAPMYENIDPKILCDELVKFLARDILDNDIQIETDFQCGNQLDTDPSKLRQVLLNIFLNAIEAMQEKDANKIRKIVFTYKIVDGRHVFSIANNGPRVPHYIAKKIFQPFITTKELGTGIGLFISDKIIKYFHGEITFTSDEKWTTFYIHLPID